MVLAAKMNFVIENELLSSSKINVFESQKSEMSFVHRRYLCCNVFLKCMQYGFQNPRYHYAKPYF